MHVFVNVCVWLQQEPLSYYFQNWRERIDYTENKNKNWGRFPLPSYGSHLPSIKLRNLDKISETYDVQDIDNRKHETVIRKIRVTNKVSLTIAPAVA